MPGSAPAPGTRRPGKGLGMYNCIKASPPSITADVSRTVPRRRTCSGSANRDDMSDMRTLSRRGICQPQVDEGWGGPYQGMVAFYWPGLRVAVPPSQSAERCHRGASPTTSVSQDSAVRLPRPGLMSKRSGASETIRQPEPNAARNSSSVTRRGPQIPTSRSGPLTNRPSDRVVRRNHACHWRPTGPA